MCCSKRREQCLRRQQELLQFGPTIAPRQRGCCGARRQQHLIRDVESYNTSSPTSPEIINLQQQSFFPFNYRKPCGSMAGLLVIGLGMGAEKLGRKISDKRLERKAKNTLQVRRAI